MEPEGSLPWSQEPVLVFYDEELLTSRPTLNLEDHSLSAVRDRLFNNNRSYPPYLKAVSSIRNPTTMMSWGQGPT
jgi:hypothetical protein